MIPNDTKVRVNNITDDPSLRHVHGLDGKVVSSYFLPNHDPPKRRYIVLVNGLDYDLAFSELEVL